MKVVGCPKTVGWKLSNPTVLKTFFDFLSWQQILHSPCYWVLARDRLFELWSFCSLTARRWWHRSVTQVRLCERLREHPAPDRGSGILSHQIRSQSADLAKPCHMAVDQFLNRTFSRMIKPPTSLNMCQLDVLKMSTIQTCFKLLSDSAGVARISVNTSFVLSTIGCTVDKFTVSFWKVRFSFLITEMTSESM